MRNSDHTPIELTVLEVLELTGLDVSKVKFFSHKLKLTEFQQTLLEATIDESAQFVANQLGEMRPLNSLERYNDLMTSFAEAINSVLPPTRRFPAQNKPQRNRARREENRSADSPPPPPPAPWWMDECFEAVKKRKDASSKYRSNPITDNYNKYAAVASGCKRVLKRAKRLSWTQFCENIDYFIPIKIWKMLKRYKNCCYKFWKERGTLTSVMSRVGRENSIVRATIRSAFWHSFVYVRASTLYA